MEGGEVTFVRFWPSYVIQFLAPPYSRQFLVRYYSNVRRGERNRTNRSKVAIAPDWDSLIIREDASHFPPPGVREF